MALPRVDAATERSAPVDDVAPGHDETEQLRRKVRTLTAQLAARRSGRSRFALELDAAGHAGEVERLRARAERAEATLADLRRDSARAILGLRRQVTFWQLVAGGLDHAEAARQAGLAEPLDRDGEPGKPAGGR